MANIIRARRGRVAVALAAAVVLPAALAPAVRAATPTARYSTSLLHFAVKVGPGGAQACDVVGELFRPAAASSRNRVAAILTTNGFGGSYTDQVGLAEAFSSAGYAVLTYSGLGFGGSGCKITLDDPLYDGMAAQQLVSYLGGAAGIAFTDAAHTVAAPRIDFVIHDRTDHAGHADTYDPRVGMIGGSYGGEIQFAAAYVDPRVDTIVPFITWSNLAYSLTPNNADLPAGSVTNPVPGSSKTTWAGLFSGDGVLGGVQGVQADPSRDVGCPNFADWVCPGLAFAASAGYADPTTTAYLEHASVSSYSDAVRIPTLIIQGENDTLFNLNEAVANYRSLRAHGVPVSMIWQSWGHSGATAAPGELDLNAPDPRTQYESARVYAWFDHYLRQAAVSTGPGFAYFRDWVSYRGIATPAYTTAASYPVGTTTPFFLSAADSLVTSRPEVGVSVQRFVTPPAGPPSSTESPDAVGGTVSQVPAVPDVDAPGTFASWSSAPLAAPLDVAGIPVLHVQLSAPTATAAGRAGAAGDLVLFAKLYDVAPDGTKSLIHGLVAPARIAEPAQPVQINLPGIVHRFAAGHRVELVLAGGDANYRGGLVATPVTVTTGTTGQVLDLPVVP